ncbi:VOC family protein [Ancylobacter sp. Lp-2]|uniref:VOC family protein n=1 Tax=Ancylobacter sp. Lp-2 TaxID=2881339 RepID=UPI001E2DCB60|nr:VOC family protein [Ancylobacter sp. Lp-2]MCB4771697.1 VOC family protein [Ancylobacter sp. Lp-2]
MIDHMSVGVSDLARSVAFYDAVLAPLAYVRVRHYDASEDPNGGAACWGRPGEAPSPDGLPGAAAFWIQRRAGAVTPQPGCHFCFLAPDREAVRGFHAAGLTHGGADFGAPGLRAHYGEGYYAAFLTDPDGWRIEAVAYTAA